MSGPTVSVVMPLRDCAAHVGEAVVSVLAQSWSNFELIVVDDGSRDGGPDIVRRLAPDARVLTQPEPGVARARNLGVETAEGEYVAFLDADDVLPTGSLAVRATALALDPSVGAVFGRIEEFLTVGEDVDSSPRLRQPVGPTDARLSVTMMIRIQGFLEVGGFDPGVGKWYFMDWLSRLSASGVASVQIPDVVVRRRLHAANTGLTAGPQTQELLGTLRSALSRAKGPGQGVDDATDDSTPHP